MLNRARNIYQQRHPFLPTIPEDDVDGDLNLLEEREYDRTEGLDPEVLRERDDQIDQEQARQQRDLENSRRLSR